MNRRLITTAPKPPQATRPRARGRHKPGVMNGLEAEYEATYLKPRKLAGEVDDYWFERLTLKLADDCRYTADFMVLRSDGLIELHEVKGFMEDDARVKALVAAQEFPFVIYLCRKVKAKDAPRGTKAEWVIKEL